MKAKHWILTPDRGQAITTALDLGQMTLKSAKLYYSAYGVTIKGHTKSAFIKNLWKAIKEI